jgi:Ran GTPase-activating protein (RanGAP) involved in mRNA processing and transport
VIVKKPLSIIQPELDLNILIEKEIMPLYQRQARPGKNMFNLALVEDNPEFHSLLNLREQPSRLIKAAFKLIRNYDIRSIDFTEAGMQDDSMRMLSSYLRSDPNLRSIVLDKNLFTDEGFHRLTNELKKNTKLAHLSIKGCTNITNLGLQRLCDVISTTNTCLFQIDLDVEQFEKELALTVITESGLNRAIQEKLRPVKIITTVGQNGEIIKVSRFEQEK